MAYQIYVYILLLFPLLKIFEKEEDRPYIFFYNMALLTMTQPWPSS